PHTIGFRLHMALLTRRVFPIPIWRMLQIRNRLVQHRPIARAAVLDFETRIAAHRVLAKGLEVDLYTRVTADGRFAWEGLTTFYARGQFGEPNADAPPAPAPAVDAPPGPPWRIPAGAALRFAQLTGDYNGLHLSDRYAGWFGYRSA